MSGDHIRIGSLCTGYGGLDMAARAVFGGTVAWVADPDPAASALLAHHHPDTPNLADITTVDFTRVSAVDIVCAGFPCQDLSYAGRGAGITEGTRSGLWHTIARAVGVLRPRLLVLENVAAIVARRPGLDVVLSGLAGLGFDAEWRCVRASEIGAAHQRNRWFCLAWPADPQGQGFQGPRLPRWAPGDHRADAHPDDVGDQWDRTARQPAQRHSPRSDGAAAHTASFGTGEPADQTIALPASRETRPESGGRGGGAAAHATGHGRHQGRPEPAGEQRGSDAALSGAARWGRYAPAVARWEAIHGAAPRPTDDRRRLNPAFVEWLMGLPAGWVTGVPGLTRNQMLRLLGNGVVPEQGTAAVRALSAAAAGQRAEAA